MADSEMDFSPLLVNEADVSKAVFTDSKAETKEELESKSKERDVNHQLGKVKESVMSH